MPDLRHSASCRPVPSVRLGRTGLEVSPVGFGGYRIAIGNREQEESLRAALRCGCNLIDTSSNYSDGASERLIGKVLAEEIARGTLQRENVVIVTKAGYLQGQNLEIARERESQGRPFREVAQLAPELWHSISPDFLEDQLTRSLERLGVDRIDVFLLHNPEYFLKTSSDHAEYYRRIARAFEYLESEAERGRISWYGISSNTFPAPKESDEYTSLETVLEIARGLGPTNRFGVIQFPFNLIESGAALGGNNSGLTVTELARKADLGTLVNRPLNAFAGNRLTRLADFPPTDEIDLPGQVREALQAAMAIESRFPGSSRQGIRQIAWGHIIAENANALTDPDIWKQVLNFQIRPSLERVLPALESAEPSEALRAWGRELRPALDRAIATITTLLEAQASENVRPIRVALDPAVPPLASSRSLSQKAIRVYRSIPGIHCILLGMRELRYVRDALEIEPPLSPEEAHEALHAAGEAWESMNAVDRADRS
jgi:aryl-alcohol dehydrogenase-like predicted oxidoreductase